MRLASLVILLSLVPALSCSGGMASTPGAAGPADGGPADGGRDAARPMPADAGALPRADADVEVAPPLRIAVLSDLNGSYGSTTYASTVHAAVERVVAWAPDLVLSTGDMVAGQRAGLDYRAMWAGFHAAVTDPLATAGIPFAVTPGNHDASGYASFADERAIFVSEWTGARKPDLEYLDDASYPLRYSFVVGDVLFVSLDATTVGPLDADQMSWLDAQLEAGADRPVKVVYGHVPLHPFAQGRESEVIGDPELERMANEHGVTLMLSGHHHAWYPGRRGELRLVGTACVGAGPRALIGDDQPSARSVALIEVAGGRVQSLEAYEGDTYDVLVPRASLPAAVGTADTRIVRDDLSDR